MAKFLEAFVWNQVNDDAILMVDVVSVGVIVSDHN